MHVMAAESPLMSVTLCTWNGARWLRPQLDSILAQERVNLELVVLDDASTDETLAILHEYAARDARVEVHVNDQNLGHLRSFSKCMSMCRGQFIAPADQDDIWHPSKLRILLEAIGDAGLAYCDSRYVDADGRPTGRKISDDLPMRYGHDVLAVLLQNSISGHAALWHRNVFSVAHPFPSHGYHDWWLAMAATIHGGIVYVNQVLVDFRRHDSTSSAVGLTNHASRATSGAERESTWFQLRSELAHAFVRCFDMHADPIFREWSALFQQLMHGHADGLLSLAWRSRARLGGPVAALKIAAMYWLKARKIRR